VTNQHRVAETDQSLSLGHSSILCLVETM